MTMRRFFWWPLLLLAAIVTWLGLIHYWQGDAIAFSYFMPRWNEDTNFIPFNSVWEIAPSMAHHYMHSTGRVLSHGLAQLFAGFLGQPVFAVCNGLVWACFAFMLAKTARINASSWFNLLAASLMTFLIFLPYRSETAFPFEPAHQIDYVWVGTLTLVWFRCLFSRRKDTVWRAVLLAVFSFLLGWGNEAFPLPVCGALLVLICWRGLRGRLQWVMTVCYGLGTIGLLLAPGNFSRAGTVAAAFSPMHMMESLAPGLVPLAVLGILWLCIRRLRHRQPASTDLSELEMSSDSRQTRFYWAVVILTFAMGIALGMGSGVRMLVCGNMIVGAFCLRRLAIISRGRGQKWKLGTGVLIAAGLLGLTFWRYADITELGNDNRAVAEGYAASQDGVVVLDDQTFFRVAPMVMERRYCYEVAEKLKHPGKPDLQLLPSSLRNLAQLPDTNLLIQTGPQEWVFVQSRTRPRSFVVEKVLLPGIANRRMADRELELTDPVVAFDSTANVRAGIYFNHRPYIRSNVVMEEAEKESNGQ